MKDIDFDELDKAVNSLMANVSPEADSTPVAVNAGATPVATPVTVQPVSSAPAIVNLPSEASTASPASEPTPLIAPRPESSRAAAPAVRRSGRFMDMVHASSEVKPRTSPAVPSREGVTISPPTVVQPAIVNATPETGVSSVPPSPAMPDPIDVPVDTLPTPDDMATPVSSAPSLPDSLESPFIADAKVEKRPLNAAPVSPPFDLMAEAESDGKPEDNSVEQQDTAGTDEPPAVPQVPELSSDLVAIESDEKVDATQAVETADAAAQVSQPSVPLGAASIPQQYKAQESSGDKSHAAIYDASQYPDPVAHPAKHSSGWLWVLWVVLLLAAGAGGAFLLFYLGIIP